MDAADNSAGRIRIVTPLPFIAWTALGFMQIVSPDPAWSWLLAGLGALILLSYGYARALRDHVTGGRQAFGTWVVAGDELRERFTLTNSGWLPVLWARVRDGSDVPGYRVDRVESVGSRAVRRWSVAGVCQRQLQFLVNQRMNQRLQPSQLRLPVPTENSLGNLATPGCVFRIHHVASPPTNELLDDRWTLQHLVSDSIRIEHGRV